MCGNVSGLQRDTDAADNGLLVTDKREGLYLDGTKGAVATAELVNTSDIEAVRQIAMDSLNEFLANHRDEKSLDEVTKELTDLGYVVVLHNIPGE